MILFYLALFRLYLDHREAGAEGAGVGAAAAVAGDPS